MKSIKVLYYDRTDVCEGIDVNKIRALKESGICHYWYFLNIGFKFQPKVCNRCQCLLMVSMNLSDIAISNIKGSNYRYVINEISKSEAIDLMQNIDLTKKKRNIIKHKNLLSHIKMGKKPQRTFGIIEIERSAFHRHESPIFFKTYRY